MLLFMSELCHHWCLCCVIIRVCIDLLFMSVVPSFISVSWLMPVLCHDLRMCYIITRVCVMSLFVTVLRHLSYCLTSFSILASWHHSCTLLSLMSLYAIPSVCAVVLGVSVVSCISAMSLAVLEQRCVKSKNKIQKLTRTPRRPPPPRWRPVVAAAGGACPASPAPGSWPRATPGRTSLGRWPPGCWTRGRTGPWGCAACPSACACLGLTITWYPSCISGGRYPRMNRKMNEWFSYSTLVETAAIMARTVRYLICLSDGCRSSCLHVSM